MDNSVAKKGKDFLRSSVLVKKILIAAAVFLVCFLVWYALYTFFQAEPIINPLGKENLHVERPFDKYAFLNLQKHRFVSSDISIGKKIKDGVGFNSYLFYFTDNRKKVSGLMNIPKKEGVYPIIVMFRGYIDKEIYTTGEGTRRSAELFAQNGFITLAPDFLGYGESDNPSDDSIEERFQTYTTALTLFTSVKNLNDTFATLSGERIKADTNSIGIWGHSNGGHIAIATLIITQKPYPTVLWNPVTKPFPFSILYYTDEFEDHGKALRKEVATFEKDYDIEKYSPTNYASSIIAPLALHQAEEDEAVPKRWSDQFVQTLQSLQKDVSYYTYFGEDHNFSRGSWSTVVLRSISFFRSHASD